MKPPAFQFYADDFLAGVADMTQAEVGAYILLLCHQWSRGIIPADADRMQMIAKGPVSDHVVAKFPGGKNARLESEREKQADFRSKQAEKAARRWSGNATAMPRQCHSNATASLRDMPKPCSPSPSPSPSISSDEPAKPARARDVLFDALAIAEGSDPAQLTKGAARTVAVALAEIKKACPGLTVTEIKARAARYRRVMPQGSTITASALAKHWARCGEARPKFEPEQPKDGPLGWRDTLDRLYPGNAINAEGRAWQSVPESIRNEVTAALLEHA